MVYNTQNQWVREIFPSLGRESLSMLGPLERANLNHWTQQSR
jgi:hypothetical protein